LTFVLYPSAGSGTATIYEDAGDGYEYMNGSYSRRPITCAVDAAGIRVVVGQQVGTFVPARQHVRLELREIAARPMAVQLGTGSAAWHYDREQRRLIVDLPQLTSPQLIEVRPG
jgi:hypothetical protein